MYMSDKRGSLLVNVPRGDKDESRHCANPHRRREHTEAARDPVTSSRTVALIVVASMTCPWKRKVGGDGDGRGGEVGTTIVETNGWICGGCFCGCFYGDGCCFYGVGGGEVVEDDCFDHHSQ